MCNIVPPIIDITPNTTYGSGFAIVVSIAIIGERIAPTLAKLLQTPIPTFLYKTKLTTMTNVIA